MIHYIKSSRPKKKFDVASFFHEQAEEGDDEEDGEDDHQVTEIILGENKDQLGYQVREKGKGKKRRKIKREKLEEKASKGMRKIDTQSVIERERELERE